MRQPATDLSGLLELARDRRLDLKPIILRVQTDLFAAAPARDPVTVEAYEALACGLIPVVDDPTLAVVALKLAPLADAPDAVLAALAGRGGEARDAVIRLIPSLSPAVLAAAAADGTDLSPLLAARAGLGSGALAGLVQRDDPAIDGALALNTRIALGGAALAALVARARHRPDLASALLARTELGGVDLAPLYLAADAASRARLRADVAALAALRSPASPDVVDADPGPLLTALSARGDAAEFAAALAEALDVPTLDDLTAPERRDLLALALRAAGVPEEDAIFIFLTLDAELARSVEAVHGLAALFRATRRATALDLLASILDVPVARREGRREEPSTHQPASRPRPAAIERPALRPAKTERLRRTL